MSCLEARGRPSLRRILTADSHRHLQELSAHPRAPRPRRQRLAGGTRRSNPLPRLRHGQHSAADEEREGRPGPAEDLQLSLSVSEEEYAAAEAAVTGTREAGSATI